MCYLWTKYINEILLSTKYIKLIKTIFQHIVNDDILKLDSAKKHEKEVISNSTKNTQINNKDSRFKNNIEIATSAGI